MHAYTLLSRPTYLVIIVLEWAIHESRCWYESVCTRSIYGEIEEEDKIWLKGIAMADGKPQCIVVGNMVEPLYSGHCMYKALLQPLSSKRQNSTLHIILFKVATYISILLVTGAALFCCNSLITNLQTAVVDG